MRHAKTVAAVTMAACAVLASTASSAAAALPELLPGTAETQFTGKSGKTTLQIKGGAAVSCKSSTGSGELTSSTTGTGSIHFIGCTAAGLAIDSLGDTGGTVLIHGTTSICYINSERKEVGVVTHLPASGVHLEVPAAGLLIVKKGDFILRASPVDKPTNTFAGVLEQREGVQAITKCEGGPEEFILISIDGGEFVQAGLEIKEDSLTFGTEEELMA